VPTEHRVKLTGTPPDTGDTEDVPERPRWWLRNPSLGVAVAAVLGIATVWVTSSIDRSSSGQTTTLIYVVILPIALLLPAIALSGAMIAWHAYQSTRGKLRLLLAAPAAAAVILNTAAIGMFIRWVVAVFPG
jgi:hypothetical protein